MTEGNKNVKCSMCDLHLPGRGLRGKKPTNILCASCGGKLRKRCGLCGDDFAPSSLKGTRFVYCLSCSRSYSKNYNKHSKTIGNSLSELECLWCLKTFMPPSVRSKCCSHRCNTSHNIYKKHSGERYRASKLMVCKCGKLISHQSKHCRSCRSAECSIDGCSDIVRSNGLCNAHYIRNLRGMDMDKPRGARQHPCLFNSCEKPQNDEGLCLFHLKRQKLGIPLDAPSRYRPPKPPRLCTHPGCDRKRDAQGLCSMHRQRKEKGVDFDLPPGYNRKYTNEICLMDGCDKPHANKGYGLCSTHHNAKTRRRYKNVIHWLPLGERDNWICHLCGEIVEKIAGTWDTPNGGNVDHLIPRSKGGLDEWDNVRLAHFFCNWERSDTDLEFFNVEP